MRRFEGHQQGETKRDEAVFTESAAVKVLYVSLRLSTASRALAQKRLKRCSMKKVRPVVARNARELAKVLGLARADGMEIELRSDLNDKIIEVVGKKGLTHSDVARLAHTSRTRVTAILNRNTHDISTDLMLRVLGSLGVQAKLQFKSAA
jgi:predicted XRE-type DNA-binding protein